MNLRLYAYNKLNLTSCPFSFIFDKRGSHTYIQIHSRSKAQLQLSCTYKYFCSLSQFETHRLGVMFTVNLQQTNLVLQG